MAKTIYEEATTNVLEPFGTLQLDRGMRVVVEPGGAHTLLVENEQGRGRLTTLFASPRRYVSDILAKYHRPSIFTYSLS